jgi:hypothetical protein
MSHALVGVRGQVVKLVEFAEDLVGDGCSLGFFVYVSTLVRRASKRSSGGFLRWVSSSSGSAVASTMI